MNDVKALLARAPEWLDTDHRLMTEPDGWRLRARHGRIVIHSRPTPDDRNDLFKWEMPEIGASHEIVFDAFVHRILDHHGAWVRAYTGGRLVETISDAAKVFYQQFDPGIPGVRTRDLCYLVVTRRVSDRVLQASYRSVDAVPEVKGFERIRWWGAHLCVEGSAPGTSSMIHLDRENQGGSFPAWLMNLSRPRHLRLRCEEIAKFFAGGGPLAAPRGAT